MIKLFFYLMNNIYIKIPRNTNKHNVPFTFSKFLDLLSTPKAIVVNIPATRPPM